MEAILNGIPLNQEALEAAGLPTALANIVSRRGRNGGSDRSEGDGRHTTMYTVVTQIDNVMLGLHAVDGIASMSPPLMDLPPAVVTATAEGEDSTATANPSTPLVTVDNTTIEPQEFDLAERAREIRRTVYTALTDEPSAEPQE
jgi:hypothetical protein